MKRGTVRGHSVFDEDAFIPVGGCARLDYMRTYGDVLGQLGTLYLTGVLSYYHLLWVRGESLWDLRPLFFLFSPLTVVAQHLLAFFAITFHSVRSKLRPREQPFDIRSTLSVLFGRVPPAPTTDSPSGSLLPKEKASCPLPQPRTNEFSALLSPAKTLGTILQLASLLCYLTYCVFSIKLFLRRRSHDPKSLANADYLALQLSIAGVFLALISLPYTSLLSVRLFTDPVPPLSPSYRKSSLHRTMLFCRDTSTPSLYAPRYSPRFFSYLQQWRQVFYFEALDALLIYTDSGTIPPIPLRAIVANYDSYGTIPIPPLRTDYYFVEVGGRLMMALFAANALRSAVRGRRAWEKEAMAQQEALLEPPTATSSSSPSSVPESSPSDPASSSGPSPPSSTPSSAAARDPSFAQRAWAAAAAFLEDPLAYTPSVSTIFPYLMLAANASTLWNRVWLEPAQWGRWPADVPCPQMWGDPLVAEWEGLWEWWWLGQRLGRG